MSEVSIILQDRIAVANPRHRRSQSADRWVDHRPGALVPIGTVLQPLMRRRRSITRLTDPKDITDGASRYCLVAQEHDTDGELETKLYKVRLRSIDKRFFLINFTNFLERIESSNFQSDYFGFFFSGRHSANQRRRSSGGVQRRRMPQTNVSDSEKKAQRYQRRNRRVRRSGFVRSGIEH